MASLNPVSPSQSLFNKLRFRTPTSFSNSNSSLESSFLPRRVPSALLCKKSTAGISTVRMKTVPLVSATTAEKSKKRYPGESKGFVEEMRFVAMKLHTRDQAKEGEKETKEPQEAPVAKWEPTVEGYLRFLVDSKLVYDTLDKIIAKAVFPSCKLLLISWFIGDGLFGFFLMSWIHSGFAYVVPVFASDVYAFVHSVCGFAVIVL